MKDLTEPLLPDLHRKDDEDISDKNSVTLSKFGEVTAVTLTTFILFIIILASQLPPQQTMGMTTIGIQGLSTNYQNSGWIRTIYGEFQMFGSQCKPGCNFEEAAAVCEGEGGHLPFIQSEEENEEIQNLFSTTPQGFWVGLISKYRKESWQLYMTEDAATYFNFLLEVAEDNNEGGCVIFDAEEEGRWRRTGCDRRRDIRGGVIGVLCERLPNVTENMSMRVMMGKSACDDGVKGIEKDLKNMETDTECATEHNVNDGIVNLKEGTETIKEHCDDIHDKYVPNHICMNQAINYSAFGVIPTHGPHRPNWASFGEYSYLPIERWQHNLEHGCVVMLYHPCLDKDQVTRMKSFLSSCLRKHIITPSRIPSLSRPLILLVWGCYLEFQFEDLHRMRSFISAHALGGPEGNYSKDGLYTHLQVAKAIIPAESLVCPQL